MCSSVASFAGIVLAREKFVFFFKYSLLILSFIKLDSVICFKVNDRKGKQ